MADVAEQLITAMQAEFKGQQDLTALLEGKIDAMQHYDMSRLEALAAREQRLLETVRQQGLRRDAAVKRLTTHCFPQRRGQRAHARELAQALDEPHRTNLLSLAVMLKDAVQKTQRLNRINAVASQKILQHFHHVFRIIARTGCEVGLYGRGGKKAFLEQKQLVDALA